MADYAFTTIWRVAAPVGAIWDAIIRSEQYPSWWKSVVRVQVLAPGDANGIGRTVRTTWKTRLPYGFTFDSRVTRIEPLKSLALVAFGDLEGTGLWTLTREGDHSIVRYDWNVKTTKPWMNLIAPIARPFFAWNHDAVMQDGRDGLGHLLNAAVETIRAQ